ncbi:hypothetical protein [Alkalispirochaeta alkalica]|uniref:hypothetical protein n=1 Tax=Alkalispirochaeta alkalica TaxID=46356 RepID=UPI0003739D1E|nr:hypothetical protein [Alkalispirochaeta alkalica]
MNDDERPLSPAPWRKEGSGELHFHSRRTEEEAARCRRWEPPQGSFFRRNRGLAIALIDVVVVVILFFIYLFVLRPLAGQVRLGEYRLSGEIYHLGQEVLAVVTVRKGATSADAPSGAAPQSGPHLQPLVTVSAAGQEIVDLAPGPGQERSIPLRLEKNLLKGEELLEILVVIGGDEAVLSLKIPAD